MGQGHSGAMQPDDLFPSTVATEDQCDGVHCRPALRPDVRTTSAEMLRLLHLISKRYPTDPELPVLVIHAAVADQVEHALVHRSAKTTPLQAEAWRLEPAGERTDGLWGALRVCATPGPHGGPWPVLETEGHFATRLANTVCAVWTRACASNLYQEVIEKGPFCPVGKTNHHANENDYTQTLSPTDLLPKIVTATATHGKCV